MNIDLFGLSQRIPDPDRKAFWITVTVVIKVATLWILLATGSIGFGDAGQLGVMWSDTPTYFDPIESLLNGNGYDSDVRMPGYGVVYLLVRAISSPPWSYDVLVMLQTLLAAFSMYILARLVYRLTGSRWMFVLTMALYAASISVHWYDAVILAESFAVSALILFLDRMLAWSRTGDRVALILAGLLLTWAIFLKPVLAPVPGIVLLAIWFGRRVRGSPIRNMALFLIPIIVIDGAWIVRNAMIHGGFHPLTHKTWLGDQHLRPKFHAGIFVIAFGGDQVWWGDPHAEVRFFNIGDDQLPGRTKANDIELPDRIMTSVYNLDSLRAIAALTLAVKDTTVPEVIRQQWTDKINSSLIRYRQAFIAEHPFQYHVLSRWRAFTIFIRQTGNPVAYAETFVRMPWYFKSLKLFHMALHWATVVLGVVGIVLWWKASTERTFALIVALIIPFGLLIFPVGLRFSEHRYLVPFIPFLLLSAIMGCWSMSMNRTRPTTP